jgi:Flp pilus assembly protein TadG
MKSSLKKVPRNRQSARRGAALVEFAITAPIFFLFLLAAFEFGWMNVIRHTCDNAAYEAARAAMVPGATATDAVAKASSILQIVGTKKATVTVTPGNIVPETTQITVAIDIPMKSNGLVIPHFTSKTVLHSESTLRTERPSELGGDFSGDNTPLIVPIDTTSAKKAKGKASG